MAITPKGIYYPEGTTNSNFVTIFSTLASSIDSALGDFTYDSGWITIYDEDMLNGWEPLNLGASRPRYRKVGNLVALDGTIRNGTSTDVFVLPESFRPEGVWPNFSLAINTTSTTARSARGRVSTAGLLQAYQLTQTERNLGISLGPISFFVD